MMSRRMLGSEQQEKLFSTSKYFYEFPDAYTAASNGKLESVVNNGDGSRTFNWVEHFPIATYLMCATASIFSVVTADYIRAPGDTVPVQYYVYPEDSVAAATNPVCNVDSVVSMMKFYSSIYGQYPFEKYAMACIDISESALSEGSS